jgi:hypothetical protein
MSDTREVGADAANHPRRGSDRAVCRGPHGYAGGRPGQSGRLVPSGGVHVIRDQAALLAHQRLRRTSAGRRDHPGRREGSCGKEAPGREPARQPAPPPRAEPRLITNSVEPGKEATRTMTNGTGSLCQAGRLTATRHGETSNAALTSGAAGRPLDVENRGAHWKRLATAFTSRAQRCEPDEPAGLCVPGRVVSTWTTDTNAGVSSILTPPVRPGPIAPSARHQSCRGVRAGAGDRAVPGAPPYNAHSTPRGLPNVE